MLVDGARVGHLARGETLEVPVDAGRHTVRVKIDFARSPDVDLSVGPGEVAVLHCRAGGPATWRAFVGLLTDPTSYISLEPADPLRS